MISPGPDVAGGAAVAGTTCQENVGPGKLDVFAVCVLGRALVILVSERDVSTHYLKKRIIVKTVRFSASQCALSPDEEFVMLDQKW